LIVMDKEFLVFVEVRTRSSEDFMTPEASIRAEKRETVRKTCAADSEAQDGGAGAAD